MYIGKFLKTSAWAAAFFAAGSLCSPGVSSAEDVWCYSRDGHSFYVDTESINADNLPKGMAYRVSVKKILDSDGSVKDVSAYGFESLNDSLVGYVYEKPGDLWQWYKDDVPLCKAIWETMTPYMDQKGIHYSDAWEWK